VHTASQLDGAPGGSTAAHPLPEAAGWLATWHLLSLDAPTVAAVWTWFVARAVHVALAPGILAAMFVAVWLLYAGDRVLDGFSSGEQWEARHWFHHRHKRGFAVGIGVGSMLLVPLTLTIPWGILRLYLGLAALLLVWFAIVHGVMRGRAFRLPKEQMPAAFCVAAVFIPVWARVGFRHEGLALAALFYGLLITLNCWCIYAWEHDGTGDAHLTTRLGVRWLRQALLAGMVLPLAAMRFGRVELVPVFVSIALAAGLLMTLNQTRWALERTDLRAAADLVLLTPLLLLVAALR